MYTYTAHERMGYFGRDVKVTVTKPLERMPYAQAGVVCRTVENMSHEQIDLKILYSYSTEVIRMYDERFVVCTGTYSQTTRRHISAFSKEYLPEQYGYYTLKELAKTGKVLDIVAGEYYDEEDIKEWLWLKSSYSL